MNINYRGEENKPEDFDIFYENLKQEAGYKDLIIEKSSFSNEYVSANDMYFTNNDGSIIHVKYTFPIGRKISRVLLLFHGYHGDSGSWFEKIALANMGCATFAMDVRGQSGKSIDNTITSGSTLKGHVIKGLNEGHSNLLYTKVFLDTYILATIANSLYPNIPIVTSGESQGGALALACAYLYKDVALCMPTNPYLCDIKHASELGFPYDGIKEYFTFEDPIGVNKEKIFKILKYIDVKFFADKISSKVVLFVGENDIISPTECQFSMFNSLNCEKEFKLYLYKGHEYFKDNEDLKMELLLNI